MSQVIFRPTGSGALTEIPQQSPSNGYHWDKVDEEVADAGITTLYATPITSDALVDLFTFTPTVQGGLINFVQVFRNCWGNPAAPSTTASVVRIESTNYFGAYVSINRTGWIPTEYSDTFYVNPSTSSRWNWSEIFLLQFGVSLKSIGSYMHVYCSQCYMVVDYTLEDNAEDAITMMM
jgi:hypothetical protein